MELYYRPSTVLSLHRLRPCPFSFSHASYSLPKVFSSHSNLGLRCSSASTSDEVSTIVSRKSEEPSALETESATEASSVDESLNGGEHNVAEDFLRKLSTKLEINDAYQILFYGSGTLLLLWVSSAVVSAIDSLPLFPKVMEVVGLGYTIWFSYRYLFFKKSREELVSKFEDLKGQIMGQYDAKIQRREAKFQPQVRA